jgi:hypothetical protein
VSSAPSSTATTANPAPDVTPITAAPAASAALVLPPVPAVNVVNPASTRAPVTGAVVVPAPSAAELCSGGYVKKNTPPATITDPIKATQVAQGPYTDKDPSHYVEDELVPVELGGAPADPRNLWPQTPDMAAVKDKEENRLRGQVCHGDLSVPAAQSEILADWGPLPKS